MNCKYCKNSNTRKDGFNRLIDGSKRQRYYCSDCKKRFVNLHSAYGFRKSRELIGRIVNSYNDGRSFNKMTYRYGISSSTPYNYFMTFPSILRPIESKLKNQGKYSTTRHLDITEILLRKVKVWNKEQRKHEMVNKKLYIWAWMDNTTKYILNHHISYRKDTNACYKFLRKAIQTPRPQYIITDAEFTYQKPIQRVFNLGPDNFDKKPVKHVFIPKDDPKYKAFKGLNNLIERWFMTHKSRTKVVWRFKIKESVENLTYMFILNYNWLKIHRMIKMTPADCAGIGLEKRVLSFSDILNSWNI